MKTIIQGIKESDKAFGKRLHDIAVKRGCEKCSSLRCEDCKNRLLFIRQGVLPEEV